MRLVGEIAGGWLMLGLFCCVVWWRLCAGARDDAAPEDDGMPLDLWFWRDFDE